MYGSSHRTIDVSDDIDKAIAALTGKCESAVEAMRFADTDVLAGRLHDIDADTWAPHVLLVAPAAASASAALSSLLSKLERERTRAAVAVVVASADPAGTSDARWEVSIDDGGVLHIPALGLEVRANRLPVQEAADLARMLSLIHI